MSKPSKAIASNNRGVESGSKVSDALVAGTPTVIGLWDLEVTHTEQSPPEAAFYRQNAVEVDESIVGRDSRTKVAARDFAEDGKYRCIVKLMARMEGHEANDPWMMGTGWLIEPDLIVTAGHMSFDWDHKFGFALEIKAWIGYYGRENVGDTSVQFRHGKTVSVPAEWIKAPRENYDVSFVKVDKPFTGVKPFEYYDTPAKGNLNLGIVGYPGDLRSPGDPAYGEHMYEMYLPTRFDLAASKKLLQYEIDTFGGNSGSPVIVKDNMKAIGVHVLGGNINSASVIGPLGNVFETYKKSFIAQSDPSFNITGKLPRGAKSFRVVTVPSENDRYSKQSANPRQPKVSKSRRQSYNAGNVNEGVNMTEGAVAESASLRSLLESSIHAHKDPEQFLGKLQNLLEPEMAHAMAEVCNGAEGLVAALQFLWDHNDGKSENNEALLSTLVKHKSNIEHVGKEIYDHKIDVEQVAHQAPIFKVLSFGMDAANELESATDESVLDNIANGLSVTVPIAEKELPKLGAIGRPIATIAASYLHLSGAQAAASLETAVDGADANTEAMITDESLPQGVSERAVLAETALHGIMHLPKGVLKQNQVYEKIHSIVKPLAPIVRRAEPMVSSQVQPAITKVALDSLATPPSSSDSPQRTPDEATQDIPQVTVDAPATPTTATESAPATKIGTTVTFDTPDAGTAAGDSPDVSSNDAFSGNAQIVALTQNLVTAHPHLAHILPGLVERGMAVGHSAFSKAAKLGLPILLGDDKESEYHEKNAESAVPVSGLAQRALLAEAALQVLPQLPVDVVKTLEIPDLDATLEAFETNSGGHDEADSPNAAQWTTAAAAGVGAAASVASSIGSNRSAAAAERANELKIRDQQQKERDQEIAEKTAHIADYNAKTGQNLTARQHGLEAPFPHLVHYEPTGTTRITPPTDALHPGSPNHPSNRPASPPAQRRGPGNSPPPPPRGPPGGPPGGPGGAGGASGGHTGGNTRPPPSHPTGTTSDAQHGAGGGAGPSSGPAGPSTTVPIRRKPVPGTSTGPTVHPVSHVPLPTHGTSPAPHSPTPTHIPAPTHTPDPAHPRTATPTHTPDPAHPRTPTPTSAHIPPPASTTSAAPHPRSPSPVPSHPSATSHPSSSGRPRTGGFMAPTMSSSAKQTPRSTAGTTRGGGGKRGGRAEGELDEEMEAEGAIAQEWLNGFGEAEENEGEGYEEDY